MEENKLLKDENLQNKNDGIYQYCDNNCIKQTDIFCFNAGDVFAYYDKALYKISSKKAFLKHTNNMTDNLSDYIIINEMFENGSQYSFYRKVDDDEQAILLQTISLKNNIKIHEYSRSINAKLTFFTVLAVLNIIGTAIMVWKIMG